MGKLLMDVLVNQQLGKFPKDQGMVHKASLFLGRTVQLVEHADRQGDHIPIGSMGNIVGFSDEHPDGLIFAYSGKFDLVFPEELALVIPECEHVNLDGTDAVQIFGTQEQCVLCGEVNQI